MNAFLKPKKMVSINPLLRSIDIQSTAYGIQGQTPWDIILGPLLYYLYLLHNDLHL